MAERRVLPPSTTQLHKLLDVEEAADYLAVSVPWIYKATRERRLPVVRIGRSLRFQLASLDRFIPEELAGRAAGVTRRACLVCRRPSRRADWAPLCGPECRAAVFVA
jgi:excisionase family DNA binding protein